MSLPRTALRFCLLLYGALNAVLYAGLLPLWDGFDEPFHYGYVQWLRSTGSLPVAGRTPLTDEIVRSLELVPVSYAVQRNLHRGVPFDQYFALPEVDRIALRRRLEGLDPRIPAAPPQGLNYEAHQAPLAYLVLAPFDALWSAAPLDVRILRLRLVGALLSTALTWFGVLRLARVMKLPPHLPLLALFVTFSSQMFYATICRVANDWLALPVWTLFLCETVALYLRPKAATAIRMALWLAAGLLTKAYFLCAIPLAFGLLAICCRGRKLNWRWAAISAGLLVAAAAPWYARNLLLYRNVTGMQETAGGFPLTGLSQAARTISWPRAAMATARTSLRTGNNSLFAFSYRTDALMLILLAAAVCLYAIHAIRDRLPGPERPLVAGQICFLAGLIYSTLLTFWYTRGAGISPAPWYTQPLLAPGMCLLFIGLSRSGRLGSGLAVAFLWLWTYVISATYAAKLIPFYAGFTTGRARLSAIEGWWRSLLGGSYGTLATTALLPPPVLTTMTIAIVTVAVTLAAALSITFCCPPRHFVAN